MRAPSPGNSDKPDTQILMAAIIRLMAECASRADEHRIRTLLSLIGQLRSHPDLPRQTAVLAGLATAHAIWVEQLLLLSEVAARSGTDGGAIPSVH